ncbi:PadR family transcriptional regulator [Paenibacillus thalictri]|uniref:PadR family transcriptional regulator n=1 Tax=Paenibacillus thalictri TaxID=2527873 RepID=A0A4V2J403_9BACL|nr:PadR family transcriptional regulator [Paenibacillus thalictri]TBL76565.1 PadR family transcriptional regulator [Paenibacillus thalictri]
MKFHNQHVGHKEYSERRRFDQKGDRGLFLKHRHGGGRHGFGGHGGGKRFFERGKFKIALLELLVKEPMHGYQLIKAMEESTGGLYTPSPGSVYPNLQLLEDMQLIGSGETDGKKLYYITTEGLTYLRERKNEEADTPSEEGWEHRGRHRLHGGRGGKHQLRGFMKEWSELIYLMSRAAEAAQEQPISKQAEFNELMAKFEDNLKQFLESAANPGDDETVTSQPEADLLPEDKRDDK